MLESVRGPQGSALASSHGDIVVRSLKASRTSGELSEVDLKAL